MKKFCMLLVAALLLTMLIPVQAAENDMVAKGKLEAADAAKMVFPTDGSEYQAICPVCQTMAT